MDIKNTEINALIGRVLSGEANQQDNDLLQKWIKEDEQNRLIYENIKKVWFETSLREEYTNADKVYYKVLEKRENISESNKKFSLQGSAKSAYIQWKKVGVAAAFLLIGILSFLWVQKATVPVDLQQEDIALVVKENPAGQKSKIVLSDGTIVWLNSESEISYLPNFEDSIRMIKLIGEAYFQVAKDIHRPFIVEAGGLQTTAVGTAFNVRHYADDSVATVFLTEGKIKIEHVEISGSVVYLEPGWGVGVHVGSAELQKFSDSTVKWTSWKDGVLFFDNAGLQEVMKTCERWYGTKIKIMGTPPQDWNFTGKFRNENLKNVLESMRYGKDFDYSIQDKYVTLTFKQ